MFSIATITANSTPVKVAEAVKTQHTTNYVASLYIIGTFDSATVSLYSSIDNGQTLVALPDNTGTAITATANKVRIAYLAGGIDSGNNPPEQIWAQAAGGGGSLNVTVTANSNT